MAHTGKLRGCLRYGCLGSLALLLLLFLIAGGLALSNRRLPTHSAETARLSANEKARLAEAIHLRQTLGDTVWPGWGTVEIPFIVYNEEYAFLVGYPDPPAGWLKMPQREPRGGPWEVTPDDTFAGQPYYRQRLSDPERTPENFTVLVGERWVATMETHEYAEIAFYADFREELPPLVREVFPYRLAWRLLMGEAEKYVSGLEHEAFHAWQGTVVPERLEAAEEINREEGSYPWDEPALTSAWSEEMDLLLQAVRAPSEAEASALARQFLARREARRAALGLSPVLVDYERQREWLEGLAKYAELALTKAAAVTPGYEPAPDLLGDPDFRGYAQSERFWSQQLSEASRTAGRSEETRFYYSGLAQAALLDRLTPAWQARAFEPGITLETLLQAAVH